MFRKKNIIPDYSRLGTDLHSHLLPGIDDGAPDINTSLQLIIGLSDLGYKKLITTPHIMLDRYPNTREGILEKLEELNSEIQKQKLNVEVLAAAEYFLDDHFANLLEKKEPLLCISENKVLVEFSFAQPPLALKEILFEMQLQGYVPVIAHPERYIYLERNKNFCDELKASGFLFQVNMLSLGSYYGREVHDFAQNLIRRGYYDLIGTDLHHVNHLEALRDGNLTSSFNKLLDSGKIINDQL